MGARRDKMPLWLRSTGVNMFRIRGFSQSGFTLIELMIVIGILGIIAAIALPLYNGYIQASREGVLVYNISTIEIFQEDFRLRRGAYLADAADLAAIQAQIGWRPESEGITYRIAAPGPAGTYDVTATDVTGLAVCMRFPAKIRCP
jgi:type IV pilus assembly protein PilE